MASRHLLPNRRTIRQYITSSCNRRDSGYWFPGDRTFSLWQEHLQTTRFPSSHRGHTGAAPVNHPGLVNAIIQFCLFFAVNFCWGSPSIIYQPCASLNLQPNTRGGTGKKISNSPYRKFVGAIQKKIIRQATKSKTNRLASNALLGPSKRQKRSFAGIQLLLRLFKIPTLT